MLTMLKNWNGSVGVNGTTYESISSIPSNLAFKEGWTIKLLPKTNKTINEANTTSQSMSKDSDEVRITVKRYMTQKATPEFDFMQRWNNDNPMPMCMMTGKKIKETRGMVYMELHGDMYAEKMCTCMQCGRKLTNPVSQYLGIGPECGKAIHLSLSDFDMKNIEKLIEHTKKELETITWKGWVIRSAVKEEVPVVK